MLIPATCYRDCEAALAFMTGTLGLTEQAVYRDNSGAIVHAQMTLGTGMMMFGPESSESGFSEWRISPRETGGRETTTIYATLPDISGIWARVQKAGCEVLIALRKESYGGEGFSIRDPEGHIWSFGTYDPLAATGG